MPKYPYFWNVKFLNEFWKQKISKLIATCFSVTVWGYLLVIHICIRLLERDLIDGTDFTNIVITGLLSFMTYRAYNKGKGNEKDADK